VFTKCPVEKRHELISFAVKHLENQVISEKGARNEAVSGGRVPSLRPPPQINGDGREKEFIWRKRRREKGSRDLVLYIAFVFSDYFRGVIV
jgi:hypothetical protein